MDATTFIATGTVMATSRAKFMDTRMAAVKSEGRLAGAEKILQGDVHMHAHGSSDSDGDDIQRKIMSYFLAPLLQTLSTTIIILQMRLLVKDMRTKAVRLGRKMWRRV